mmetsp:Transcript_120734/g.225665  ORF Transcript_120734/g.225665 Transcript_120734/m.225665 type:complete len:213 (-) Transcript_120734:2135-2773(-)
MLASTKRAAPGAGEQANHESLLAKARLSLFPLMQQWSRRELIIPTRAVRHVGHRFWYVFFSCIEVPYILWALHFWPVWWRHLDLLQSSPIILHAPKPLVLLDVGNTTGSHGESLAGLLLEKCLDKVSSFSLALLRQSHPLDAAQGVLKDLHWGGSSEGWIARQELKHHNAKSPPINCMVVSTTRNHLRCEIVGCSTSRVRLAHDTLRQTHIN